MHSLIPLRSPSASLLHYNAPSALPCYPPTPSLHYPPTSALCYPPYAHPMVCPYAFPTPSPVLTYHTRRPGVGQPLARGPCPGLSLPHFLRAVPPFMATLISLLRSRWSY
eukprot:2348823-Rhodomonas_salina.3